MYFERRLWRLVETFVPRLSDAAQLVEMASVGGRFVRRLDIAELMPPVIRTIVDDHEQTPAGQSTLKPEPAFSERGAQPADASRAASVSN